MEIVNKSVKYYRVVKPESGVGRRVWRCVKRVAAFRFMRGVFKWVKKRRMVRYDVLDYSKNLQQEEVEFYGRRSFSSRFVDFQCT